MTSQSVRGATLSEGLVHVAMDVAAKTDDVVRMAAVRSFFDFLGCVIGPDGEAVDWPESGAARLAVLAHLSDQDDLHLGSISHPGGVIWSAVVACAVET